jgi:uncharacterized protein (DUF433 family)
VRLESTANCRRWRLLLHDRDGAVAAVATTLAGMHIQPVRTSAALAVAEPFAARAPAVASYNGSGGSMDWRSRVVAHPDVLVGKPVIKGTRISVELVMDLLAAGYTTEQIVEQYDHLTREDIQACLAYAKEIVQTERVYTFKR